MQPKMELLVWVGDFGLVSMSMECIQAILYIKLAKAPVRITYSKNPYLVFHQDYPVFRHGAITLTDFKDIVDYLKIHNYYVDYGLSGKQVSEAYAIINMVTVNLRPILYYSFWIDSKNYEELTSLWYGKVMPIPFNFIYPRRARQIARSLVGALFPREQDIEIIKNSVTNNAMECFSCLASRLGHSDFFYGNSPTTLDAIVYAHLAPLVKIPFPSDHITKLLSNWPELEKYIKRIDNRVFPDVRFERKYLEKQTSSTRSKEKEEDEFAATLAMKIFMCAAAACAMLGYAVSKNIIDIDRCRRFILH
ncbi:hypothetical protein ILUMI_01766 [Ignelater luminosus]|uniref:Metaxin n=1 Tax=Ignelater luminosus TaxID=2038154 RepID=A0A8K0GLE8_IGNLU|nr:hypothetical protein ILUMI_01766 [Ignelater luminosus]